MNLTRPLAVLQYQTLEGSVFSRECNNPISKIGESTSNCCLSTACLQLFIIITTSPWESLCANRARKDSTHFIFFPKSLKFGIVKVGETCSSEAVLNTEFS